MSDFIDSEAEESEEEELDDRQKKKFKKSKPSAIASDEDDDEEEDDEEKLREELGDLIDDNPIEEDESSGSESGDDKTGGTKRKRDDDDDELDDRLSDDDFDLLEENLGIKVKRKKTFVRVKRVADDDSDDEGARPGHERDAIANELFEGSDGEDDSRHRRERERSRREDDEEQEKDKYSEEEDEDDEDIGDFIVDAEGQPIHGKRKKRKAIYTDAALQEAQDIFGVDFDYDDVNREGEEYEEDEEEDEEYEDEEGVRKTRKKVEGKAKKKSQRKTIYDVYEPSELERGHFTDLDETIRKLDMPERMQLRHVPITSVDESSSNELDLEADWIYKYAFSKPSISNQTSDAEGREKATKGPQTIEKIRKALEFMRNQHLEVPFIAFYRKEYVQPELTVNDLWRVYKFDEKWTQLQTRKRNMLRLFEKMHTYQSERLTRDVNESIPENVRVLRDEDMDRLRGVQSLEELNDVYSHFILYYGNDVPAMQEAYRLKEREKAKERRQAAARRKHAEDGIEGMDVDDVDIDMLGMDDIQIADEESTVKQARRSDLYSVCAKAGLDGLLRKYGLTPEQFAENMRDNYQRHEVEQYPTEPSDAALDYVSAKFPTSAEVLKAANYMMAVQIGREPLVRQCVREAFYERARIDVIPTKQGLKEIDENHSLYAFKFIKDKPVRELTEDQYLRLANGEQDKLITVVFQTAIDGATTVSYADEVKALFQRDEFSKLVQDWNDLRNQVVEVALNKIVFPALVKELKSKLMNEAREFVLRSCCKQLYDWLKVAPYKVDETMENDEEWDTKTGLRVMAISYVADLDQAAFGCLMNGEGECTDHIRLEHILKRSKSWREKDVADKEKDLQQLSNFISNKRPHVIAVSGESREATMLIEDLKLLVAKLVEDESWPNINIELIDNNLAKVFSNSTRAEAEFREYPALLREAISIARCVQDPLIEFSQLCNSDDEILCLKYHPLQDQLSKEELLEGLTLEFVNRTNEVGVDINRAINYPHTANLVQFVCGLGPRKGQALIKILKQNNQRLENRTQLVTTCHMGPKVFINCSGFIKIDTNSLGDSTESYVEILDGSRVHPETYEWARKMAVDALEYDEEETNPAGAVDAILDDPDRLKDLDLDAFADELERQGFGNKGITLYDIRSELNCRYKELRVPFQPPDPEQIFNMLTKETPQTFFIGKLVMATVTGFQQRKPKKEELDRANPTRNDETGLWVCPFCRRNDFPDLSEVWNHFDTDTAAGGCGGQANGVRVRLENGLNGYIPIKNLSDSEVTNPEERVRPGQTIHCRVIKIEVDRFSVMATCKSSDLMDRNNEWKPPKDAFYDTAAEEAIQKAEEDAKKVKQRQSYTKRVIVHPSFKNIGFREAEKLMMAMDQGEVIVRPSSKGTNHLTVTWKVGDGVCQHVDVREEGKENAFSLGQSLWIGEEEFEDLDEIVARYINPMAGHARDVYAFRYFRDLGIDVNSPVEPGKERERADKIIKEDKAKNPAKIHYFVSASREFPGKFMLSYLPRGHTKHEFVTVTPEGFRFRSIVHDSLPTLFRWFKEHFRDPIPGSTPRSSSAVGHHGSSSRTPGGGYQTGTTPNAETLHRVAQSIPSHMLASLSQAAHFQGTPTAFGSGSTGYPANTPYTPSGQTPFMTPFATTPHQPQTPRYSGSTPAPTATPAAAAPTFRTPAAPGVHRGYGTQSYSSSSSSYNRGGGNRNSQGQSNRAPPSDDWGSIASAPTVSRSAAPSSSEPDDWTAAADAWASSTTSRNKTASSTNAAKTPVADDWGAADAWASGGTSAKTTPRSSSAAGDWGASPASGGNNRGRATPSSNRGTPAPSADDWGEPSSTSTTTNNAAADEWAGVSSNSPAPKAAATTTTADPWGTDSWGSNSSTNNSSSKPVDDWGSSSTSTTTNSWSNNSGGSSSRGRGGGGGGRGGPVTCYKCNQEGHMSRECPNPPAAGGRGGYSGGRGGRGGGAGGRACFKCNQEGHMSRDCPNPSSGGGNSGGGNRGGSSSGGGGWSSSYSSRPGSAASGTQSSAPVVTDDWGADANAPVVAAATNKEADSWASVDAEPATASKSATPSGTSDWDADAWASGGTSSTPTAAKTTSNSDWGTKTTTDDWGASKSSASKSTSDDWGSSSSTPAAKSTNPSDDWSSSSTSNSWSANSSSAPRGGGGRGGGSGRGCFKCGEEGHMSRDCPTGGGGGRGRGGPLTCFKCGEEGHMSRDCTNPNSSGGRGGRGGSRGGRGGGAPRSCFKCNQEGHMSYDCPTASSGGGRSSSANNDDWGTSSSSSSRPSRGASSSGGNNDDWGSAASSSSSSRFGRGATSTGANTEPLRPRQRTSSKPSTPANDDWGAASGGDSWSSKPSTPAADDWGTGTVSSGGGRAASSASSNKTPAADDWGVSDPWGSANSSSSNNRNGGMDRSSQRSNRPPSTASAEIWDTEGPVVSAPSKDAVDDWGVATGSSSSTRRGSRTPMEMGDATPLYDE